MIGRQRDPLSGCLGFLKLDVALDAFLAMSKFRRILLQAEVDALERLHAGAAAELAALLPAILDRAFKGEL